MTITLNPSPPPLEPLTEGYHGSSRPPYDSTPSRGETEGEYLPS
nr:hypothetical protein [uncultured Porphyromonas sp.]